MDINPMALNHLIPLQEGASRIDLFSNHGEATGTAVNVNLKSGRILIVFTQAGAPNAHPLTSGAAKIVFP